MVVTAGRWLAIPIVLASAAAGAAPDGHANPGDESGRVDEPDPDSTARVVARGALWVPRTLLEVALAPVQGTVWVYDRYQLEDRYYQLFYNRDRTFGITPAAAYATGLGFVAGAQLTWDDALGDGEHVELRGMWGGTYRMRTGGSIDTGQRLGRLQLRVAGGFDRLPDDPFFGIGNASMAVEAFNRYQVAHGDVSAAVDLFDHVAAIASGSYVSLRYAPSRTDPSIETIYPPSDLVGFQAGVDQLYTQGELRWDSRGAASWWEPEALHGAGTYADGFAGYVHGRGDASSFWRYGFDLQHYFHIAPGPRVLEARLYGEGVTGDLDQVPFSELPHLGGDFLRGYTYDRFRDRIAALATLQYYWDVSPYIDLSLFADAGRVYRSLGDLTLDELHVGAGPGLGVHGDHFLFETYLGFAVDGGVTFSVVLKPITDRRAHWW